MPDNKTFDYVIVGGGTVGCVLAHRLTNAGASVVVIEAGPEQYDEMVMDPGQILALASTALVQNLNTVQQPQLNNREIPQMAGRLLSGSSAVNYGNWTRCDAADYDEIAALVGDPRWSYESLLPYFKANETHYDPTASPEVHGFSGPIHTTRALDRQYPLQASIRSSFLEAGLPEIADINTGHPVGFGPFTENWRAARRQPAGKVFPPSTATILTNTTAVRILIDPATSIATGVALSTGEILSARNEVILSAGSLGTPKLLLLSGLGPCAHLSSLGIPVIRDLPVGENLHDHLGATLYFRLRRPERGLAIGHPEFKDPRWFRGNPIEWIASMPLVDDAEALAALAKAHGIETSDPWARSSRAHVEMFAAYAPISAPWVFGPERVGELVGSHVATPVLGLKPRSRGTVRLKSSDPREEVVVDPAYLRDPVDRVAFRTGFRWMLKAMLGTEAGREMVVEETPPPGMKRLGLNASDAEIDERVERIGLSFFQISGTAAMGSVVESDLRVKGIKGLRVADASVFPVPLAGHYQCPVYVLAQVAADLILEAKGE